MASGVKVSDEIPNVIQRIQIKSEFKYIIFRLNPDMTEIVVDKMAPKEATYDEFIADLKEAETAKECRWAVVDFQYKTRSMMTKNKLVYYTWNPDCCPIKQKMVYAASNEALKRKIGTAVGVAVQATDLDEVDEGTVESKILSLDKA